MVVDVPLLYALLPLTVPLVGYVTTLWTLRLLRFLGLSYIIGMVALKDLRERYDNLLFNLKCFFAVFGFSLAMFLIFLYFYTSTFPIVVSFARTLLFWFGKVVLLTRLLNKFIVYKEIKKLDSSITVREFLFTGGTVVTFSKEASKVQVAMLTANSFAASSDAERHFLRNSARDLGGDYTSILSKFGRLKVGSQESRSLARFIEKANTHHALALKYQGSNRLYSFVLTSDGRRVPKRFYGYDQYLGKTYEGKTEFVDINSRILVGSSEKGQSVVTNAAYFTEIPDGNFLHVNALPSNLYSKINHKFFYDEEVLNLLRSLKYSRNSVFEALNSASNEEEFREILSRANGSGFLHLQDLRGLVGAHNPYFAILTDLFI